MFRSRMAEVWLRAGLVVGVVLAAAAVTWSLRRRAAIPVRRIDVSGLEAGVYFFSASTCDTCEAARQALREIAAPAGFTEFAWEQTPEKFAELGVEAVPATLVVPTEGEATLHTGMPRRLRGVGGP